MSLQSPPTSVSDTTITPIETISPQGNASTTADRNTIYSGTAASVTLKDAKFPLYLDDLILTGLDGVGAPINQHLQGRITDATVNLTIEGASTIVVTFADADRGVLRSPVLATGLPSVSAVATELLNDINTLGVVTANGDGANLPGGSTFNSQVPKGADPAGAAASDEATRNQQLLVQIGVNLKLPREAVVVAMMTMLDESGGVNDTSPDENGSSGVMQQTPSQGWGTREQVNDPVYAINKFYTALQGVGGWQNMDPWVAAQMVQRSAWTGHPNKNNNYSSELGGNYHQKYDQALQIVQSYRPASTTLENDTTINGAKNSGVRRKLLLNQGNKVKSSVGFQAHAATAHISYKGVEYSLVRVDTNDSKTVLTFEDAMINTLRRNRDPYTSAKPTSIPLFVNQLLSQDGFSYHFVQQGLVVSRKDPTGALDAGLSDPGTLANFDQLLATDGQRGTGTLRQLTKFASVVAATPPDPVLGGSGTVTSSNGVVNDSWTVIADLVTPLRWLAMSDGRDFYIGSEQYVSHYINKPPILVAENEDGVAWLNGEFDLGTETSNTLSFVVNRPFVGVPAQKVIVQDMGLLSGIWMVHTIAFSAFSAKTTVTCQRIQADLQDPEHQAATDKLLTHGGGITTTNLGVLAGNRPQVVGQASQNGWASGDPVRAEIQDFMVPGTDIHLSLNRVCGPLLVYVADVFNTQVEALKAGQCGGYADRHINSINGNSTVWSNHSSGTAIDLNSLVHPQGQLPSRSLSPQQITIIHNILKTLNGAVRWGGDWSTSSVDTMHFEINTDAVGVEAALSLIGKGIQNSPIGQGHVTGGH